MKTVLKRCAVILATRKLAFTGSDFEDNALTRMSARWGSELAENKATAVGQSYLADSRTHGRPPFSATSHADAQPSKQFSSLEKRTVAMNFKLPRSRAG